MITESRLVDGVLVLRLLRLFAQDVESTDAYKYGIVDKDGKKIKNPDGSREKDSYTILNRFVFKIKRALMKSPDRNARRFLTVAAALSMLKEHNEKDLDSYTESDIEALLDMYETDELVIRESRLLEHNVVSFKTFHEEMGVAGGAIAGIGIDHPTKANQAEPGRDPVMQPMARRKKKKNGNS
jgi:hypothetical protein